MADDGDGHDIRLDDDDILDDAGGANGDNSDGGEDALNATSGDASIGDDPVSYFSNHFYPTA